MGRGSRLLPLAAISLAALALLATSSGAHLTRYQCNRAPVKGHGSSLLVDVRFRCNYPISDFRIRLAAPGKSSIIGAVQGEVDLQPTPNWSRHLGPIYIPPQKRGPEEMSCERDPPLPSGLGRGSVKCIGNVEPGTWVSFAFKATRSPCDQEADITFNYRAGPGFTICEHGKCFDWGYGVETGAKVRC